MKKQQIIETIKSLANSQGFYTRLYNCILKGGEEIEEYLDFLENKNFKDPVDLIMYLEG